MSDVPRHIVAVSALIQNEAGHTLLVQTHNRSDTWEMPGGQVEEGEPLHEAVCREVEEETGIIIEPLGITGVYFNQTSDIVSVVFRAHHVRGDIVKQDSEIKAARFIELSEANIDDFVKRPHFKSRILDAMQGRYIPYEVWETKPYTLLERIEPGKTL
ncbi:NUDIX hydrolase [Paenibacillus sp. MER TA 81-3]|uniref:NUDIX hydrolase n=1 Tax=Paenibacillus sp. MER TA 81-3 TaxID=2939573 RepID=UPI00203E605F|nr:NUDIX hydrolase [Paenibacillus sp. MER TA 81-3]MCM3342168.1 NUDIX hydrolase [Paenibacillus sp. MER TA 81-3]